LTDGDKQVLNINRAIYKFSFAAFGGGEEGVLRGHLALRQRAAALCTPAWWLLLHRPEISREILAKIMISTRRSI